MEACEFKALLHFTLIVPNYKSVSHVGNIPCRRSATFLLLPDLSAEFLTHVTDTFKPS